jgi:hypothetical protein
MANVLFPTMAIICRFVGRNVITLYCYTGHFWRC